MSSTAGLHGQITVGCIKCRDRSLERAGQRHIHILICRYSIYLRVFSARDRYPGSRTKSVNIIAGELMILYIYDEGLCHIRRILCFSVGIFQHSHGSAADRHLNKRVINLML